MFFSISAIITQKGGKIHFHAPIVCLFLQETIIECVQSLGTRTTSRRDYGEQAKLDITDDQNFEFPDIPDLEPPRILDNDGLSEATSATAEAAEPAHKGQVHVNSEVEMLKESLATLEGLCASLALKLDQVENGGTSIPIGECMEVIKDRPTDQPTCQPTDARSESSQES